MRIISGNHRGRQLQAPASLPVRPTTDFAKSGLFNMLNHRFDYHRITALDLYSGTGSLTYELLSRGALQVTAVDNNPRCVSFIRETLRSLGETSRASVLRSDALRYLKSNQQTFDLILADPPFDITPAEELINLVIGTNKLKAGGLFVLEHSSDNKLPIFPGFIESRRYGQVSFSFFGNSSEQLSTQ